MKNSYFRLSQWLATGSVTGSGLLVLWYNLVGNDKNKVYANSTENSKSNTHYVAVHKWDANWDRRSPSSLVKSKGIEEEDKGYQAELEKHMPKATRHIFLIRHGQYNIDGNTDKERYLTALGQKQAEYTGNRLKELNFPYTSLIKSTMSRAQETAAIILKCLENVEFEKIKDCSLLEEGAPIPPEPPVGHWKPEAYQFYQDGPRIEAAFRKYIHRADVSQTKDSYEIIVCHSNIIRYFICRALQFPPDAWLRFTLHHCSITWLVITPSGRVIVRGLGDSGHIPSDAVTSS